MYHSGGEYVDDARSMVVVNHSKLIESWADAAAADADRGRAPVYYIILYYTVQYIIL